MLISVATQNCYSLIGIALELFTVVSLIHPSVSFNKQHT